MRCTVTIVHDQVCGACNVGTQCVPSVAARVVAKIYRPFFVTCVCSTPYLLLSRPRDGVRSFPRGGCQLGASVRELVARMLDAEDLSSLVPVPPKDGGSMRRRAAPRKSDLPRVPLTGSKAIAADDAFGHLSSLAAGMSPRTVDGLIKAVRKEAADYVVARQAERSAELKREREAAAKARRGSLSPEAPRRGSLMPRRSSVAARLADAGAAPAPAPEPALSDTPSGRVSPVQPDELSSSYTLKAGARPARDHAQAQGVLPLTLSLSPSLCLTLTLALALFPAPTLTLSRNSRRHSAPPPPSASRSADASRRCRLRRRPTTS